MTHAPRIEVDRLDLRHVHRSRREDPPRRAEHVPDPDPSGDHLADEAVEGVEVLAADDGRAEVAALDGVAQGPRDGDRDVAAAELEDVRWSRHEPIVETVTRPRDESPPSAR